MKLNINGNEIEIADEDITKAITEKQETFEVKSDLVIRSAEDETVFAENKRKEGIAAGAEIGRKEVIKGLGIEGEGLHKSDASSIKAIQSFSQGLVSKALEDAKIEPNTKIAEKDKDILTLKGTIETLTTQNNDLNNNFKTFKNTQLISSSLSNEIPDNVLLPKSDTLTLMQSKIKLDVDENGNVFGIGKDGQPLKDANLNLLPVKDIAANFFNENNQLLKPASGGAGGGDSGGGGGKQSIEDFSKEMKDAGHSANSPEFNRVLQERMKANTIDI